MLFWVGSIEYHVGLAALYFVSWPTFLVGNVPEDDEFRLSVSIRGRQNLLLFLFMISPPPPLSLSSIDDLEYCFVFFELGRPVLVVPLADPLQLRVPLHVTSGLVLSCILPFFSGRILTRLHLVTHERPPHHTKLGLGRCQVDRLAQDEAAKRAPRILLLSRLPNRGPPRSRGVLYCAVLYGTAHLLLHSCIERNQSLLPTRGGGGRY